MTHARVDRTPPAACDVAVVGAGVIGSAVAWRVAERGLRVALVDDHPGCGASYAAAGMLAPVAEASYGEEALLRLCLESARRYPAFLAEARAASGLAVPHQTRATLVVATDDDDLRALLVLHRYQDELGLSVRRLTARDCRRLEPLLSPRLRGGLAVDGDHAVDPRALVRALLAAAVRAGVRPVPHRAAGVVVTDGAVAGVRLADGSELTAGTVVVAAGAWSGRAADGPLSGLSTDLVPPVRPVQGAVLRLRGRPAPDGLARTVRGWVHGSPVYAVPYGDGRVVVGATSEERGFDTRVTAGAAHALLRDALTLVPSLGELELVETTARLRPCTPDNAPLIGATALPGLVLATGHYRNGVLLAAVTADAVSALLTGEPSPDGMDAFCPRRFAGAGADQEVPA
jgi:glycine oxidase